MRRSPAPAVCFVVVTVGIATGWGASLAGCRNTIVGEPDAGPDDAGPDGGEGEGEGEGEGGEGEGECPAEQRPAVSLRVSDDATSVVLCDAVVSLGDGAFNDTAVVVGGGPDCRYEGAVDRPGSYVLTVREDGYADFQNPAFVVDADACGDPITRQIDVRLDPI